MISTWSYIFSLLTMVFLSIQIYRACKLIVSKQYELTDFVEQKVNMQSELIRKDLEYFKKFFTAQNPEKKPKPRPGRTEQQKRQAAERKRKWWAEKKKKGSAKTPSSVKPQQPPALSFQDVSDKPS